MSLFMHANINDYVSHELTWNSTVHFAAVAVRNLLQSIRMASLLMIPVIKA